MNRVCFARARRPVEQQPFPRLKLQRLKLRPHGHESRNIAVEQRQGFLRQDYVVTADLSQPVHFHYAAAAHRIDMPFERDNPPPVRPALGHQKLEFAEQRLGEICAALADRDGNFNLHTGPQPEPPAGRHHDRERQTLIARQP